MYKQVKRGIAMTYKMIKALLVTMLGLATVWFVFWQLKDELIWGEK